MTILVADDHRAFREVLRLQLEEAGYRVLEATDGNEAWELCRTQPVELIITDVLMPEKDGLELIRDVRAEYPDLAVIAVSGGGEVFEAQDAVQAASVFGADRVLTKPLRMDELLGAVAELLGQATGFR